MIKRIFFEVPIVILAFLAVLGDLMASKSAKIDFLDAFLSKGENKILWVFNFFRPAMQIDFPNRKSALFTR